MDDQGSLKRTLKVREKLGNSTIIGDSSLQKNYVFYSLGKGCTFLDIV